MLYDCREEDITKNGRVQDVLRELRARAGDKSVTAADGSAVVIPGAVLATWKVHIVSRNTFPTAAGLASSAAGYACLVHTLADVLAVKESYKGELSTVARQGSGSACRSLYGGFVRWDMGGRVDGRDSLAIQIATESHWSELSLLILVVSDAKKDTGSTDGMVRSVATSELLRHRALNVVPDRLAKIENAYKDRDFETFARITMQVRCRLVALGSSLSPCSALLTRPALALALAHRLVSFHFLATSRCMLVQDSNQFHAVCLDTFPPISYMNDTSRRIIALVHKLNEAAGRTVAGYTFDAGPNAVLFCLDKDRPFVLATMLAHFPAPADVGAKGFCSSPAVHKEADALLPSLPAKLLPAPGTTTAGAVRYVYVTSVGDGPRVLPAAESLADAATGLPLASAAAAADGEEYAAAL